MIREYKNTDLNVLMEIWLDSNIRVHSFISKKYWESNYDMVKNMLPQAELYVYEDRTADRAEGFIGLNDQYIAGIFVRDGARSRGIGKQLLDHVKAFKPGLRLSVYRKNERAVRFYRREGFIVSSENVDENTKETELVMVWNRQSSEDPEERKNKRETGTDE